MFFQGDEPKILIADEAEILEYDLQSKRYSTLIVNATLSFDYLVAKKTLLWADAYSRAIYG